MRWFPSPKRPVRRPSGRRFRPRVETLEDRTTPNAGIATFDPTAGTWTVRGTASPGPADVGTFQFGSGVPVSGDFNGDHVQDIGTFNPLTATWSIHYGTSAGPADATFVFGSPGEIPVVGDWNGDGKTDIGVFDPTTATWSLRLEASAGPADGGTFQFGQPFTLPVAGDWDGDGKAGIGTFNPLTTMWAIRQTADAGPASSSFLFGAIGAVPLTGDWNGDGQAGIGTFTPSSETWTLRNTATAGPADVGTFQYGATNSIPVTGNFAQATAANTILNLTVKPLDLNLLGLHVTSSPITVTVTADPGNGKLLGNLLTTVGQVVNTNEVNNALNAVLGTTVDLLNESSLAVGGVLNGALTKTDQAGGSILNLYVAPVHLDLLGARVDTSPITLAVTATTGQGQVLGNALADLINLFNPPLPSKLNFSYLNARLTQLINELQAQIPGIAPAPAPAPTLSNSQFLALTVPAINLNLLGLNLQTTPITVDASAQSGNGELLGNVLQTLFNTLGGTPDQRSQLNQNVNTILGYVVGVLNHASLTLPAGALNTLSSTLQQLALPNLISATPGQTANILDLVIATPNGTPPVDVNLLGLNVSTSNINAHLTATTGSGQVLGNLLYNVANLVNPGGPASLVNLLTSLGGSTTSNLYAVTSSLSPTAGTATPVLTLVLPPLNINLLGLQVQSDAPITVDITAQQGNGLLLGNILTAVSGLLNTQGLSSALNNVLGTTVNLLNQGTEAVNGVLSGVFTTAAPATQQILDLAVAPIHAAVLGVNVDTSPIHLTLTAHSGDGLVLGNILMRLVNLFNPPLPSTIDLATINTQLENLLNLVNQEIPNVPPASSPPVTLAPGQILDLTVPAINLNLLGLLLQTSPITINATGQSGNGLLLGNVLETVLNTLNATPDQRLRFNQDLNAILAKVVGVLNAGVMALPPNVLSTLTPALQELAIPGLTGAPAGSTIPVLNLVLASPDGTSPPVNVNLLGLDVTTSNITAQLSAETGDGLILGNLLYNLANLLNPGGSLLTLLGQLGV